MALQYKDPGSMLNPRVQILIVDDHPMMRAGLAAQLSEVPQWEVSGEAATIKEAMAFIKENEPDLAIIDISLKQENGIDLVKEIKSRAPRVKMLVLSAFAESLYAERALRAGALGYLNKQETSESVIAAISQVLEGKRYVSEELMQLLLDLAINPSGLRVENPVKMLSDREMQVFRLIGEGLTTGHIARSLHISTHTVDTHRENIKRKLHANTGAELSRRAVEWVLENS